MLKTNGKPIPTYIDTYYGTKLKIKIISYKKNRNGVSATKYFFNKIGSESIADVF